jgi:hypothetical protein
VALIRQAAKLGKILSDEEVINGVLAVDLSSGFIWGELSEQVNGWIERAQRAPDEHGITKWILYLSALEEGEEISLERIQQQLKAKEGKDVPLDTIRQVLIRLANGGPISVCAPCLGWQRRRGKNWFWPKVNSDERLTRIGSSSAMTSFYWSF